MNKDYSFISIVIPCFNETEHIGKCIESIRNQQFDGDYEIIAVDNGSTDDTIGIITNKKVILEHSKLKRPAAARNKGIKKAKGEIIIFIDADCIARTDWLKNIILPFVNNDIGCVAGEIIPYKPRTRIEQFLCEKKHLSQSVNVNHNFLPYAATANAAYRRDVFEKVGFFDESLIVGEDADLSWRMQLYTKYKVSYTSVAVVNHPYETRLNSLLQQTIKHAEGAVDLYKKYKQFWPKKHTSLKQIYWEYYIFIKKLLKLTKHYLLNKEKDLDDIHLQTILEAGWKLGLIKGSIRNRIWYI